LVNRLVVEDLVAGYGAVTVLHGVSIEIREGELVAVLGTNGNGKSTLLNCILGLLKPRAAASFSNGTARRSISSAAPRMTSSLRASPSCRRDGVSPRRSPWRKVSHLPAAELGLAPGRKTTSNIASQSFQRWATTATGAPEP
jgi:energy-coupling factor transporter ATP-binding protein EcfA2